MVLITILENKELINNTIDKYELKDLKVDTKETMKSIKVYLKTLDKLLLEAKNRREVNFIYNKSKVFLLKLRKNVNEIFKEYSYDTMSIYAFKLCRLRELLCDKKKLTTSEIKKKIKQIQLLK